MIKFVCQVTSEVVTYGFEKGLDSPTIAKIPVNPLENLGVGGIRLSHDRKRGVDNETGQVMILGG